jgi:hypothetical protein
MGKPSASPSISDTAVVAMAELATHSDFNAFRAKNTNNTKERLQHELDYITWAINKKFAGDDASLSTLHGIFEDARRSATKDWPSWTVGAASSAGMKRAAQVHPDLALSSDDDEDEAQPIGKGKAKAKSAKVAKTADDSETKRKGGLNGLTYFMSRKVNRDAVQHLGHGGADTMTTLRFCFDKFGTVQKDAWQRLSCVVNFHHDEHREEVSKTVPADKLNKELNARWEAIMNNDAQLVDYVTRWEQQDKKSRKVTIPPPALILPHEGPECPNTYPRSDNTVIDYTIKKKYKTGSKAGEEYTEQELANERYERAQGRLAKQKENNAAIAAGNAFADGEDDAVPADGAAAAQEEEEQEPEIMSGETDDDEASADGEK